MFVLDTWMAGKSIQESKESIANSLDSEMSHAGNLSALTVTDITSMVLDKPAIKDLYYLIHSFTEVERTFVTRDYTTFLLDFMTQNFYKYFVYMTTLEWKPLFEYVNRTTFGPLAGLPGPIFHDVFNVRTISEMAFTDPNYDAQKQFSSMLEVLNIKQPKYSFDPNTWGLYDEFLGSQARR